MQFREQVQEGDKIMKKSPYKISKPDSVSKMEDILFNNHGGRNVGSQYQYEYECSEPLNDNQYQKLKDVKKDLNFGNGKASNNMFSDDDKNSTFCSNTFLKGSGTAITSDKLNSKLLEIQHDIVQDMQYLGMKFIETNSVQCSKAMSNTGENSTTNK